MRKRVKVPWVSLVIAVVAAGLIAGCGSDDDSDSSGGSGTSAKEPARGFSLQDTLIKQCEGLGGGYTRQGCEFVESTEPCDKAPRKPVFRCVLADEEVVEYAAGSPEEARAECQDPGDRFEQVPRDATGRVRDDWYRCTFRVIRGRLSVSG